MALRSKFMSKWAQISNEKLIRYMEDFGIWLEILEPDAETKLEFDWDFE